MGSPETCPTCYGGVRNRPGNVSTEGTRVQLCVDPWHAAPTPPAPRCPKCDGTGLHILADVPGEGQIVAGRCPKGCPTPPAPADARPMVVGGAFVKFDRPAPADDAVGEDDVRRCEGCNGVAVTTDPEDVPLCRPCAKACDEPTPPAPDAGAAERAENETLRRLLFRAVDILEDEGFTVFPDEVRSTLAALRGTKGA